VEKEEVVEEDTTTFLDDENWFGNETEHEVVKSEHIGGEEHEGELYFPELDGKEEAAAMPTNSDFKPVHTQPEVDIEESFYFDNEYDKENEEFFDIETQEDLDFEKVLEKQDGSASKGD